MIASPCPLLAVLIVFGNHELIISIYGGFVVNSVFVLKPGTVKTLLPLIKLVFIGVVVLWSVH